MDRAVVEIFSSKSFFEHAASQKKLTIIQFLDEENASCQIMSSVFDKIQEYFADKIVCYTLSKPAASDIWEQFQIYQTPTYLLMKENRTVEKIVGLTSFDSFKSIVNNFI